ncbi:MAG: VOC family protein [Erysipelotrichaceae bacterium]|nr:VOC family protein [Erysipelotrichaceae bacterium]
MKFNALMHISFYTDHMEEMIDFYCHKLGLKQKVLVRNKSYKGRTDRPQMATLAENDPEDIFNVYIELTPGQFIELFPAKEGQTNDVAWNSRLGYSHFSLTVDDIFETKRALEENGIVPDSKPSKGPSETWQMWIHDPDGNKIEIMQYTERSYQVVGHID